ncbi:PAZ and/or dsrm domain containing protein [Asbolus verrucosus]|uniref:PAZ and/or dsrm domain containing protein n=1 Tax=Asbolus verrucosus TaxID=1661398 RepID=A0A482W4N1_ASBVE|nr:PAZ and/or dsrm domain containing protein [Asbolus verrucosus]
MPWYRNQDQPQYFYVAEICSNLNPSSDFPGSDYATFEEYYLRKYNIQIQNRQQHLLDVDHTSARLNFLTPRYVNRKGVALPTSSEATKRAKREKLEQKQILVPELCAIHPFSASLWRKAVCLPCILYRINALLLADQIRRTVAIELNLGKLELDSDFKWPPLNFGWSLADVLKKSKEEEKKKQEMNNETANTFTENPIKEKNVEITEKQDDNYDMNYDNEAPEDELIEIGTWSNDMAQLDCDQDFPIIRYASPTSWMDLQNTYDDSSFSDSDYSGDESESEWGGLRIEFTGDNVAEALDDENKKDDDFQNLSPSLNEVVEKFVRLQEESGHTLVDELYLVVETEEVEDVEVPKALGDVFESVAGAIFLDSGMSLDAVWKVYYNMMKTEIEQFSNKVPKSPIRELLELEPETAKFGKPEKLADGRRVRVTVEVFGKGVFKGIGRNYRIAKCTAAKCALKNLKKRGLIKKVDES